jgi:hypothetical protein
VHDKPVFTESISQVYPIAGTGQKIVTFRFQIAMRDVVDRAVDVLAEEAIRVSFPGQIYSVGFAPVPFEITKTIALPKIPAITLEGTRGSPAGWILTVLLRIKNTTNAFPLDIKSID